MSGDEAAGANPVRPSGGKMASAVLKATVSVGILAYILWTVDVAGIARVLSRARPGYVGLALALYLAGQVLSAFKWKVLAEAVGLRRRMTDFLRFYFIGMFLNVFGLGTVGGDVVRAFYLAGGPGRRTLALNTVIADRASGLLVLLGIALVALLLFRTYELPAVLYWTALLLSAVLLVTWRLAPRLLPFVLSETNRFRRLVEDDMRAYWGDGRLVVRVATLSLLFHASQVGVQMLLALGLSLPIPVSYFWIFVPLVNIFSALPISWNGLGVREGGMVFFLTHIGIGSEAAVAFSLLWLGNVIASALMGGVVALRLRRRETHD